MSTINLPTFDQIEVRNQIIEQQALAIKMKACGLKHKITIHRESVPLNDLFYLAGYFETLVKGTGFEKNPRYIRIENVHCDIIIESKTK